jgi:hypothetical protein
MSASSFHDSSPMDRQRHRIRRRVRRASHQRLCDTDRRLTLRGRALEHLEPRTLLAVLPAPLVMQRVDVSNPTTANFGTNESSPSITVSPVDPMRVVAVWTTGVRVPTTSSPITAGAAYSTNGGQTWSSLVLPDPIFDPSLPPTSAQRLARVTDSMVAFDRLNNIYIVSSEQFTNNTRGAIILQKFAFQGVAPVQTIRDKVVYAWNGSAAVQPYLAVDTTLPTYTDPNLSGKSLVNPSSGNVYIVPELHHDPDHQRRASR